jgi:2-polyprenyl-6-methoxyphenol hydroxylase-like FAD-dependent oxidoreductase
LLLRQRRRPTGRSGQRARVAARRRQPRGRAAARRLAAILLDASKDRAEVLFGDTITALEQDDDGVEVTLQHAAPGRFDLVIGADGPHSVVRRLVFARSTSRSSCM